MVNDGYLAVPIASHLLSDCALCCTVQGLHQDLPPGQRGIPSVVTRFVHYLVNRNDGKYHGNHSGTYYSWNDNYGKYPPIDVKVGIA